MAGGTGGRSATAALRGDRIFVGFGAGALTVVAFGVFRGGFAEAGAASTLAFALAIFGAARAAGGTIRSAGAPVSMSGVEAALTQASLTSVPPDGADLEARDAACVAGNGRTQFGLGLVFAGRLADCAAPPPPEFRWALPAESLEAVPRPF